MQASLDLNHLFSDGVKSIETYIMFRIKQETQRLKPELMVKNRAPINLSIGAPVKAPPEFVINALKNALSEPGFHLYSSPKGEPYYLQAVAARMKKRFGVELDQKTEICSLIGSKEGLAHLFNTLINPVKNEKDKDIILIPDPGYASYQEQIKVAGGKSFPIPLNAQNNYMPSLEKVVENLKKEGLSPDKIKAVVINYPSNPLGAGATREYLKEVVDFARSRNILLVSDLAYADVYFEGEEPPASILEIEGAKDVAVEFHSLSKPYSMTGWRAGWICGNNLTVSMIAKIKSTYDSGIFKAIQRASAEILTSEEGDKYIKEANKEYQKKQEIMIKGIKELGWDIDNLLIPKATFYLWLPIPSEYATSEEYTQKLLEKSGIVAVPGSGFGKYGEGFFRMSVVASDENLYEVIDRMKQDGFYFKK
ncbi:MAG: aminotransferase class I/II-fold pyridoxal phosphate-dependent enzyme [Candidatus Gastranaerophilales bacterium]|nr:aminotransferase class I/II-fold pyridoxal phosphate-dependent enzyme [Candidatus Gastranaerophilales bacterium]